MKKENILSENESAEISQPVSEVKENQETPENVKNVKVFIKKSSTKKKQPRKGKK